MSQQIRRTTQSMPGPTATTSLIGSPTTARVVLLAGGMGTRLAERTDSVPKPLVEIGGLPVLWHILKIYASHGFDDFLIAAGYRARAVKRFFLEYRHLACDVTIDYRTGAVDRLSPPAERWRVSVIDTGLHTQTGGRIARLIDHLDDTFMVTYGDGVGDVDITRLLAFHRQHGRQATMTVVRHASAFGHPVLEQNSVRSFVEKPTDQDNWINAGFYVFERPVLELLCADTCVLEKDALPALAAADQLRAFRHDGFWAPMDTLRDVRRLNDAWDQGDAPWKVWT